MTTRVRPFCILALFLAGIGPVRAAAPPARVKMLGPLPVDLVQEWMAAGAVFSREGSDLGDESFNGVGPFRSPRKGDNNRYLPVFYFSYCQPGLLAKLRAPAVAFGLSLSNTTDECLKELRHFRTLQLLEIGRSPVTDAGLKALAELPDLRRLDLRGSQVRGETLSALSGLKNLRSLDLQQTKVTDGSLDALKELKSLRALNLAHTEVTDVGLEKLKQLVTLRYLNLASTKVTDEGIAAVKKAIPGLEVSRRAPFGFAPEHINFPPPFEPVRVPGWLRWLLGPSGLVILHGILRALASLRQRASSTGNPSSHAD